MVQGRSAAQQKHLDISDEKIGGLTWAGFTRACCEVDIRDNFYHSWMCRGKRGFDPELHPEFAPPFLREDRFQALKVSGCFHKCVCVWGGGGGSQGTPFNLTESSFCQ